MIIKENSFEKIRNQIKGSNEKDILFSENDDLNRKVLEKLKIDMLIIPLKNRKDFMKQRNSGFNQVMAKIAKKNNVVIGIYLDEIIDSKGKEKAEVLARIIQNIDLCNKYKIKMKFFSEKYKRDVYDLKSLGLVLGMPTWMTKLL